MKEYRNSKRTKEWIKKAFIELIGEKKQIEKISIQELANKADITKTTFYYHYEDIYSVVEELENEVINELSTTLEEINNDKPDDYRKYVNKMMSFIHEHEQSYQIIVKSTDLYIFSTKLKNIFTKQLSKMAPSIGFSDDKETRSVQVSFIVSACADVIIEYLNGNITASLDVVENVIVEALTILRNNKY